MAKKMLIDATHAEETRVVVIDGNQLEEFDFEAQSRKQLAGNIYLARVTRVEPSLQAAFIEYGGNRHGFLAFNEIHPDYYQIPAEERRALIAAQEADHAREDEDEEEAPARRAARRSEQGDEKPAPRAPRGARTGARAKDKGRGRKRWTRRERRGGQGGGAERVIVLETGGEARLYAVDRGPKSDEGALQEIALSSGQVARLFAPLDTRDDSVIEAPKPAEAAKPAEPSDDDSAPAEKPRPQRRNKLLAKLDLETGGVAKLYKQYRSRPRRYARQSAESHAVAVSEPVEVVEEAREAPPPPRPAPRRYRIQDVIKRRQIMLVQVVKEERGNKGAALTTYLSIAGRYCVLMPNTARGGGISRKITNAADRKRLKEISNELQVPKGVGLIVRTAGAERSKNDIRRDYEYLIRQWDAVRERTLKSIAPTLIYEEGSLIKRAVRDLYSPEIDTVLVAGEAGHAEAHDYMAMISPGNEDSVRRYDEPAPLFSRFQVESQLGAMFSPTVTLKSGGYIVIGITEALVAIDVNSGRSTKEGSIEETALKTNLEAAEEIARQLRLRDLAGLIVIDFIDMMENRNNRAVERRLKDALRHDRARLQLGRISGFGLLEMSRQRLRPGMLEAATSQCPHCSGSGLMRSDESLALSILRAVEDEAARGRSISVTARAPVSIANFLINAKRAHVADIEARSGLQVFIEADPLMIKPEFAIEREKRSGDAASDDAEAPIQVQSGYEPEETPAPAPVKVEAVEEEEDDDGAKRRRGRRGGRKRRRDELQDGPMQVIDVQEDGPAASELGAAAEAAPAPRREPEDGRRRNGRRGPPQRRGSRDNGGKIDPLFVKNRLLNRPDALDTVAKRVFEDLPSLDVDQAGANGATHLTAPVSADIVVDIPDRPDERSDPEAALAETPPPPRKSRPRRTGWWSRK